MGRRRFRRRIPPKTRKKLAALEERTRRGVFNVRLLETTLAHIPVAPRPDTNRERQRQKRQASGLGRWHRTHRKPRRTRYPSGRTIAILHATSRRHRARVTWELAYEQTKSQQDPTSTVANRRRNENTALET